MFSSSEASLIFYNARKASDRTIWDRVISLLDGSPYSHVELAYVSTSTTWSTYGCHISRGGVRNGHIPKSTGWLEIPLGGPVPEAVRARANAMRGAPYALHKLPRTKFRWWPTFGKGMHCASFIARAYGLDDPDSYGVRDVLHALGRIHSIHNEAETNVNKV